MAHYEKEKPIAAISSINFVNNKIEIRETGKEVVSIPIDDNIEDIIDKFGKKDVFNLGRLLGEKDVKL